MGRQPDTNCELAEQHTKHWGVVFKNNGAIKAGGAASSSPRKPGDMHLRA